MLSNMFHRESKRERERERKRKRERERGTKIIIKRNKHKYILKIMFA